MFFFQAEDGIRDLTVTGVQTCALPICATVKPKAPPELLEEMFEIQEALAEAKAGGLSRAPRAAAASQLCRVGVRVGGRGGPVRRLFPQGGGRPQSARTRRSRRAPDSSR